MRDSRPINGRPRPRILFVHNHKSRFVELDLEILQSFGDVTEVELRRPGLSAWRPFQAAAAHDVLICWFASWHALPSVAAARIWGKPAIVVGGGYDIASLPDIGYGHQRGGLRRWASRTVVKTSSRMVATSRFSAGEAEHLVKGSKDKVRAVYLGVPDEFGRLPETPREKLVITVGNVSVSNLTRKGLQVFAETARLVPGTRFVMAGKWLDDAADRLLATAPSNLELTGEVSREGLVRLFENASVYVQASRHEGFGLSVAEAMLAGCIPVVSAAGSLPEVVGSVGRIVDDPEARLFAPAVEEALEASDLDRSSCRDRILREFPVSRRKSELETLVREVLAE